MEQRTVVHVPLAAGLNTKADPRALDAPALSICRDAEFDSLGGLVTRKPYAAASMNIVGGGTIANPRKLAVNGGELLLFTDTMLYTWIDEASAWAPRGEHLAVTTTERTAFAGLGDQHNCDRAELGGVVFFVWQEGTATAPQIVVAAADKTTGATVMAPTIFQMTASIPRLVALTTRVLLFCKKYTTADLMVLALDPANVATSYAVAATSALSGTVFGDSYDVTQVIGANKAVVAAKRSPTTSYSILTVTGGLTVTASTKARTCDGPIAVSSTPTGVNAQVVRASGNNIVGDLIDVAALTDVYTAQAIGTFLYTCNQIAAAHRSVANSGSYRCYVFWDSNEQPSGDLNAFTTKTNWVDDGNNLGAQSTFMKMLGPGSRAFDYAGRIFLWMTFAGVSGFGSNTTSWAIVGAIQNAYFLVRDDGFLVAKCAGGRGGGFASATGMLPGVALTGGTTAFSWCATERRRIPLGSGSSGGVSDPGIGYGMRAPRDVTIVFDDNAARRTARLGETLYVTGGQILQYDGTQLVELGFHLAPWWFNASQNAGAGLADGTYAWKLTWRWNNAKGERDRSTSAIVGNAVLTGGPNYVAIQYAYPLTVTRKVTIATGPSTAIAVEYWRTPKNPTLDSPFYLVSGVDPTATTNPNRYVANDASIDNLPALNDAEADAVATVNATNLENGAVLPNLPPPAATIIVASADRLFLAGVAGDPDRVWYSKQRGDGEVAAFNDALVTLVPPTGGAITGLAFLNETLIVFRERAIYALSGDGFDNLGGGANYSARLLSSDVGAVSFEAIGLTAGGLMFKSSQGWYMLNHGWGVDYVGEGAAGFDAETVLSVLSVDTQQQARIVSTSTPPSFLLPPSLVIGPPPAPPPPNGRILIWDTLVKQWGEWTTTAAIDAVVWNGTHYYLSATTVYAQQADFSGGTGYGMDVELAYVKPAGLVGRCNVRWVMPLGEFRSSCLARVRLARDYRQDGAGSPEYFDDKIKTPAAVVGGPMQVRIGPKIQNGIEAIKVRITAISAALAQISITVSGATMVLTAQLVGVLGNAIVLGNSVTGATLPSATDGPNLVTLTGPTTTTFQKVIDAITKSSQLVTAKLTAGAGSTAFPLASFTGTLGGGVDWPTGEAMRLTGVGFEIGMAPGLFKLLAQQQKA